MWQLDEIDGFELEEYLLAKFTHDLAGVLGAIDNSIEYLEAKNPEIRKKAEILIKESSRTAVARLKFFRRAFGNIHNVGEADLTEIKDLAKNYLASTKTSLSWSRIHPESAEFELTPPFAKLIANLIYICHSFLIHGGTIEINFQIEKGKRNIEFIVTGKGIKLDESVEQLLVKRSRKDLHIDAKLIQPYYTSLLSQKLNSSIIINKKDDDTIILHLVIE